MSAFKQTLMISAALAVLTTAAAAGDSNTVYIDQDGVGNTAKIHQATGPGGNDIGSSADPVNQTGDSNAFAFSNSGCCNDGNRYNNDITKAEQVGDNNWMNVRVWNLSNNNQVQDARQIGNSNRLLIEQNGSKTGIIGTVLQEGDVNSAVLKQSGSDNTISNVAMIGSNNGYTNTGEMTSGRHVSLRVVQSGAGNIVSDATMTGENNRQVPSNGYAPHLDIRQVGGNNLAYGIMMGSNGNHLNIYQNGDGNDTGVDQGDNVASTGNNVDLDQIGDGNYARASQIGSYNSINAFFTGNNNGLGSFTGDALSIGLSNGMIDQNGSNNLFNAVVTGDSNMFASHQIGDDNLITVTVDGNSNQFAIAQTGDINVATLSQIGNGNIAGITQ